MTDIKRRLTDIKFEHEGAHVALVGKHQGGPANGITTLVFKATDHIDPATIALAVAGQSVEQPTTIIEEPIVEQIEKSVHEALIQKAVDELKQAHEAALRDAILKHQEVLKSKDDRLAEFEAAEAELKVSVRKAALTDAKVPADQVEAVLKSLEALSEEAFASTVALMKSMSAAVDNSDMMTETGVAGAGAESQEEVDRTTAILKARYGVK